MTTEQPTHYYSPRFLRGVNSTEVLKALQHKPDAIDFAFTWSEAPEGRDFWSRANTAANETGVVPPDAYRRLVHMARQMGLPIEEWDEC